MTERAAESATAAVAPAAPAPAKGGRLAKIIYGVLAVLGLVLGVVKLIETFTMPDCTAKRTRDTLASILRGKDIQSPTFAETRETGRDPNEIACAAVMTTGDGRAFDITYRVFKQDDGKTMVAAEWRPR